MGQASGSAVTRFACILRSRGSWGLGVAVSSAVGEVRMRHLTPRGTFAQERVAMVGASCLRGTVRRARREARPKSEQTSAEESVIVIVLVDMQHLVARLEG